MSKEKPTTQVPKFGEFGVYMNNKIEKLHYQNQFMTQKSQLFNKMTFHINGDTTPPAEDLKTMILENGGQYEQYRLNIVDYFIANELSESKKQMWKDKKVIYPNYIVDCIKEEKLVEYQRYLVNKSDGFIQDFYKQSRLHYLSMWKAELKKWCSTLEKKTEKPFNFICHIDLDAFFVNASLLNYPHHKNVPVVVSHGTNTNSSSADIASCNYISREFGLRNGMLLGVARQKCSDLIVLPYDFELYRTISRQFYNILIECSDAIEAVSCDEAYIDISSHCEDEMDCIAYINELRLKIYAATQLNCSAGISINKLLARIATNKAKPNGEFFLEKSQLKEIIGDLNPDILPGIGRKTKRTMEELGIRSCSDLLSKSLDFMKTNFGKNKGATLYEYIRGIDKRPLNDQNSERQSVSAEINWGIRFSILNEFIDFLKGLSKQVVARLHEEQVSCEKCTLKLMIRADGQPIEPSKYNGHGICDSQSYSINFKATDDASVIESKVIELSKRYVQDIKDLRGVGIQLQQLSNKIEKESKKRKTIDKELFYASINKSVYDELPSSLQNEVYQNWKRTIESEMGLSHKLKKARNAPLIEKINGMPLFDGTNKKEEIMAKLKQWISSQQSTGLPADEDKLKIINYFSLLIQQGYCDVANELIKFIDYLVIFKPWQNEFKRDFRALQLEIQKRFQ